jgi:hypothetical protein
MTDTNGIEALKASFRGALTTAAALAELTPEIEALDPSGDVAGGELDELSRVTLAHAVAAQALRGLVETMRSRRSA